MKADSDTGDKYTETHYVHHSVVRQLADTQLANHIEDIYLAGCQQQNVPTADYIPKRTGIYLPGTNAKGNLKRLGEDGLTSLAAIFQMKNIDDMWNPSPASRQDSL